MQILNSKNIGSLSFTDSLVEEFAFDPNVRSLLISIDNAWLNLEEGGIPLSKTTLHLSGWTDLYIRRLNPFSKEWTSINPKNPELLRELCVIKVDKSVISLSGFSMNSGEWVEWSIQNPEIHGEFDIEESNQRRSVN